MALFGNFFGSVILRLAGHITTKLLRMNRFQTTCNKELRLFKAAASTTAKRIAPIQPPTYSNINNGVSYSSLIGYLTIVEEKHAWQTGSI